MRKVQGSRENKSKVVSEWPWGQARMQGKAMEYKGRIYESRSVGGVLNDRWPENSLESLCLDDEYGLLSDRFVSWLKWLAYTVVIGIPSFILRTSFLLVTWLVRAVIGLPIFVVATLLSWLKWLAYTVVIGIPSFILRTSFLLVTWLVRAVLFVVSGIIILFLAFLCASVLFVGAVFLLGVSFTLLRSAVETILAIDAWNL